MTPARRCAARAKMQWSPRRRREEIVMHRRTQPLLFFLLVTGCDAGRPGGGGYLIGADMATAPDGSPGSRDLAMPMQQGCGELQGCYTVYAHSDHVLYDIDLPNKMLVQVGPFKAPLVTVNGKQVEDTI